MSNQKTSNDENQPGLFVKEDADARQATKPPEALMYVLTNNLNLVDILSSGMIKPAVFYEKYYRDLGSICPQSVPLLKSPPSPTLIDAAIEANEITFPVVLEIPIDGLSGPAWVINAEFKSRRGKVSQRENVIALLINGVLPSTIVSGIHFRSETDLQEFRVRKYANLDPELGSNRFRISPHLFAGDLAAEQLLGAIEGACKKIPSLPAQFVSGVDAVSGMLSILGKYALFDREFPLQAYADILNIYLGNTRSVTVARPGDTEYGWLVGFVDLLPADLPSSSIKENTGKDDHRRSLQILLARLAIQQSIILKPDEFSPDSYLETLWNALEQELRSLPTAETEKDLSEYRSAFSVLRDVRTGFSDLSDFFERFPGNLYPIIAGLFLHLSDNRPQNVIHLGLQYPEFPVEARAFAACLAGALHGRTRLDLEARSGKNLSYVLEMTSIASINKKADSIRLVDPGQKAVVVKNETGHGIEETLLIGNEILIKRVPSPKKDNHSSTGRVDELSQTMISSIQTMNKQPVAREKVALRMEKIIEKLRNADSFTPGTPAHQLAVVVCRLNKWFDLISTVIPLKDQEYYLENHRAKHEFRASGYVIPEYRINKPDEFRSRLGTLTSDNIEQMKESKLMSPVISKLPEDWFT